jgi:micrococcal nuclease
MLFQYYARLVKVVDGDTLDMEVDLGFGITRVDRFRLYGLNAPEMSTPEGKIAKAWVITQLAERLAPFVNDPFPLTVRTYKDKQEKYGRYLATVSIDEKWDLNAELVAAGHAVLKDY